ncbi:PREDICTED: low-density lipoprotein receptor-related protein 6-like [Branchiostoma belcheri]|uniref:Low-density lipoprotein receptor-related protein 6-like n=1 Tax=Branchiostoma belcheri TaxID=7741 RepID=A0A6P5A8V1_BRABE|nr:PREDICTED: low-density lipoprotein receptor-related protein 6-like [Branchiostoma belcheri]
MNSCTAMEVKRSSRCAHFTGFLCFLLFQVSCGNSNSFILVADRLLKGIYQVDVTSGLNVSLPLGELPDPSGLDYDHVTDLVYWSDVSEGKIMRAKRDGANVEVVAENGVISPTDVALDLAGGNIYWTDSGSYVIRVARMDGEYSRVIVREGEPITAQPQGIALDPENGYMYWTSNLSPAKIERAAMDGTGRETLVNTGLKFPRGLAIDKQGQMLYWCDGDFHQIMRSDLQGNNPTVVFSPTNEQLYFFGIVVEDSYIYWTAWALTHITRTPKDPSAQGQILPIGGGFRQMMDLHLHNPDAVADISNACTTANGGCSHLCLARPGGRTCACDDDWTLQQDGTTCQLRDVPTPTSDFLLVADSQLNAIFQINVTSGAKVNLPLGHLVHPVALDYDPETDYVYWADPLHRKISRVHRNGSGSVEDVATDGVLSPLGLALDLVGGNIYWTDSGRDVISVAKLDGMFAKDLISEQLDQPHGLVLDPQNGYMYWADWGSQPKIERAAMDGTGRVTLVYENLQHPTGLAIDLTEQRLYWCDSGQYKIESIDLSSGARSLLKQRTEVTSFFDIAVDDSYVYWSAWNIPRIARIVKDGLPREETVSEGFGSPKGMHVQKVPSVQRETNACTTGNGGCQQLCLVCPGGRTCACQNGETLAGDGLSCRLSGVSTTTQPIKSTLPYITSPSQSDGLSLAIKVGIAVSGFALFIVITAAIGGFHCFKKWRQNRAANRENQYPVDNPAFDDEIYDVIQDEGFISVAAFPPPVPPPLNRNENDYIGVKGINNPSGYEVPSTLKRATPTDPIKNHNHKPAGDTPDDDDDHDDNEYLDLNGMAAKDRTPAPFAGSVKNCIYKPSRLPGDDDTGYDYTYPDRKTVDPYQRLGGSYQQHHEYQGLRNKGKTQGNDYTHPQTDPYHPLGGSYERHSVYQGLRKKSENDPPPKYTDLAHYFQPNVVDLPDPDYNHKL